MHVGAGLVKLTFAYATDVPLNPNEFRLLTFMALTALDADDPPRYFDSREASAVGIGRRVSDDPQAPERIAAFEAVKVATRGLTALGAIDRVKAGHRGQRAEYAIRLDVARTRTTEEFRRRAKVRPSPFPKADPSPIRRLILPHPEGSPFPQGRTEENED